MSPTTRSTLIGIVILIAIALLGYFAWQERQTSTTSSSTATSTPGSATTTTGVSITVPTSGTGTSNPGYTIKPITGPVAPNYKTPLTFPAGTNTDVQASYQGQFAAVQTTLASTPSDFGSWIQLGILRQETGDYTGAAADWKYVTEIYPKDPTAFADLGNLYATYLKQSSTAIADYKEAIKLDPTQEETLYQNLAQIYINEGDTSDAKATLQQGINAQVVGYQNLQTMLNSMQ